MIRGPNAVGGTSLRAAISVSSAAVMNVGWYAVTPVWQSDSPAVS